MHNIVIIVSIWL